MIIGVDFDNTIVCYDSLFHKLAVEQGLVPANLPPAKNAVRDYLRQIGQEDRWTELQGCAYGPGMKQAQLFAGVLEFFDRCRQAGMEVFIVSHRTRYPFLGKRYDLHQAARDFLAEHGFNDPAQTGLPLDHIWFHETKAEKIARVNEIGCTHFIDDLPEVLAAQELNKAVERILFDPNGQHQASAGVRQVRSWQEVDEYLMRRVGPDCVASAGPPRENSIATNGGPALAEARLSHPTPDPPRYDTVAALLCSAGLPREFQITALPGGGNNRVYRVDCNGRPLLLKAYFHHPDDPRDRLAAEFTFSRFAWDCGIRCVPQPIACDDQHHLGLYEFIEGRPLAAKEISAAEVDQAAGFFAALNRQELDCFAAALPVAAEAYFTLAEHLNGVERRIQRLRRLNRQSRLDHLAADWLESELWPTWYRARELAKSQAAASGLALDEPLTTADRCISPSDFGFHNAILTADGRLRFIDFEYAGWDDPVKTICDFICQPRLPAPEEFAGRFTDAVLADCSDPEFHRRRAAVLLPIYRLKWCCIMMNEFLPVGGRRRSFARDDGNHEQRKRAQLEKSARALLQTGI
jgi:hypothetical protein